MAFDSDLILAPSDNFFFLFNPIKPLVKCLKLKLVKAYLPHPTVVHPATLISVVMLKYFYFFFYYGLCKKYNKQ